MEFGFGHVPTEDYRKHVELVQLAEQLGFDFAWIPDQTFHRDPYVILTALALATQKIHLGVGVTNPYTRHPAMAARAIASLDEIAPGRIHLGIGAGNRKELLAPLGYEESQPAAQCREMLQVVKSLLTGDQVNYRGKHFQTVGISLNFKPRPGIPLYIAGRGPLVLQVAGELADGAIIGALCTPKGIGYGWEQIRRGAQKSGRDLKTMRIISWVTCQITAEREPALKNLKLSVAHIIGGAPLDVLKAVDLPMDRVELIKSTYKNQGIPQAAEHVTDEFVDTFMIVGDAKECVRRIRLLEETGVTQLSVLMPPGKVEQHKDHLRNLAEAIFPSFK